MSARTDSPSNSPYTPDLRGFIEYLETEHPEQIVRISKEVDPKFGVSGILERLERDGRFPLVIFENVKGSKFRWSPTCTRASSGYDMPSAWNGAESESSSGNARRAKPIQLTQSW